MSPSLKPLLVRSNGPLASPAGASFTPASFVEPLPAPKADPPSEPLDTEPPSGPLPDEPLAVEPAEELLGAVGPLPCEDPAATLPLAATTPVPPPGAPTDPLPLATPLEAPAPAVDPEPLPTPWVPASDEQAKQAKPTTARAASTTPVRTIRSC